MKYALALFVSLLSFFVDAQNFGYFSKKNYITLSGMFQPQTFNNLVDVLSKRNTTRASGWPMGYGINLSYERQTVPRRSYGFELQYKVTGIHVKHVGERQYSYNNYEEESFYDDYYNYSIKGRISNHEHLRISVFSPAFVSTFTKKHVHAPLGLTAKFGIGLICAKIHERAYNYDLTVYANEAVPNEAIEKATIHFTNHIYHQQNFNLTFGLRAFSQTTLTLGITPSLMWSFGVRTTLQFLIPANFDLSDSQQFFFNLTDNLRSAAMKRQMLNVLELNSGFTFVF